jgi:hypothetical protein
MLAHFFCLGLSSLPCVRLDIASLETQMKEMCQRLGMLMCRHFAASCELGPHLVHRRAAGQRSPFDSRADIGPRIFFTFHG